MSDGSSASDLGRALDAFLDEVGEDTLFELGDALPQSSQLEIRVGPGTVVGDFELVGPLGQGSMGVVFEARQLSVPGRRVAVKLLRDLVATRTTEERFQREIRSIGRLDHPAVVPVVAAGVHQGIPYYAMKLVQGVSLARLVDRLRQRPDVPATAATVVRLAERAARNSATSAPTDGTGSPEGPAPRPASSTPAGGSGSDAASNGAGASAASVDTSGSTSSASARQGPRAGSRPGTARRRIPDEHYQRWVCRVGLDLADALQHAHERDVVHRDVKPSNIVITTAGRPVLVDFGLAQVTEDPSLTLSGDFLGTLAYAAPEQIRGDVVDVRADVYSLGATLYELLTLNRPFQAQDRRALLHRIEHDDPPPLGDHIPRDLRTIVRTAMAKSPSRRYATPGELAHDLREFLAGRPIVARPPGLVERAVRWARAHPRTCWLAALALLLLAGFRVAAWLRADEALARAVVLLDEAAEANARRDAALALLTSPDVPADGPDGLRAHLRAVDTARAELPHLERLMRGRRNEARMELDAALLAVPGHTEARAAMAQLHADDLRARLLAFGDVTEPEEIDAVTTRLARHDDGTFADWLDATDDVELSTPGRVASITVYREGDPEPRFTGRSRVDMPRLEEGSWYAEIHEQGFARVRYPFLVRRRACRQLPGDHPPRGIRVTLLPEEDVGPDFVPVPAGWSLLGDPLRWVFVDDVLFARFELTYGDWIGHLERDDALHGGSGANSPTLPCFADEPASQAHIRRGAAGAWELDGTHRADWPVRAVPQDSAYEYIARLAAHEPCRPDGWRYDLPTEAEWERGYRGADGRPYITGWSFSWDDAGGYYSGEARDEPWPFPVGRFERDVSPFGVRDLAGSVREATRDHGGPVRERFVYRGGSYLSTDHLELGALARRSFRQVAQPDGGLRLVKRRVPSWQLAEPEVAPWQDDFERGSGPDVGNGWVELAHQPLHVAPDGANPEDVTLVHGAMVLRGGVGNFSNPSQAWRVVGLHEDRWAVEATLAMDEISPGSDGRSCWLELSAGFIGGRPSVRLQLDARGELTLVLLEPPRSTSTATILADHAPRRRVRVRLERDGDDLRAWCGEPGAPFGPEPRLQLEVPEDLDPMRYLGFVAHNYGGMWLEVDDVVVHPEP